MPAYFLLDMLHRDYGKAISACRTKHTEMAPGCNLSITTNVAKTKALVKVAGVQKTWLRSGAILDSCDTYADHRAKFVPMMSQLEWKGVDL